MIHRLADCMNNNVPDSTNVWQFCVIFPNCTIGENCNLCANVLIENAVVVGDNVTIKSGVQLWDGVILEDNVCIGPNVTFTNDRKPKSKNKDYKQESIIIKRGASIGAISTILPGVTIGEGSLIGAGSVVTKDVPSFELWLGNPAKFYRKISKQSNMNKDKMTGDKNILSPYRLAA